MGLGGWRRVIPSVGGYNPTQVGRLVGEAAVVAAAAVVARVPHTQLAAAVVGAAVDRRTVRVHKKLVAVRSSVIERYC